MANISDMYGYMYIRSKKPKLLKNVAKQLIEYQKDNHYGFEFDINDADFEPSCLSIYIDDNNERLYEVELYIAGGGRGIMQDTLENIFESNPFKNTELENEDFIIFLDYKDQEPGCEILYTGEATYTNKSKTYEQGSINDYDYTARNLYNLGFEEDPLEITTDNEFGIKKIIEHIQKANDIVYENGDYSDQWSKFRKELKIDKNTKFKEVNEIPNEFNHLQGRIYEYAERLEDDWDEIKPLIEYFIGGGGGVNMDYEKTIENIKEFLNDNKDSNPEYLIEETLKRIAEKSYSYEKEMISRLINSLNDIDTVLTDPSTPYELAIDLMEGHQKDGCYTNSTPKCRTLISMWILDNSDLFNGAYNDIITHYNSDELKNVHSFENMLMLTTYERLINNYVRENKNDSTYELTIDDKAELINHLEEILVEL